MKTIYYSSKEKGQGLVEFVLILVLVPIVTMGVLAVMGPAIRSNYEFIVAVIEIVGDGCAAKRVAAGKSENQNSESWKRFNECMKFEPDDVYDFSSYTAPEINFQLPVMKGWV